MSDIPNPTNETKTPGVTVGTVAATPLEPKAPASVAEVSGKPGDTVGRHFISLGKLWKNREGTKLVPDGHEDAATLFASKAGLKFDDSQLAGIENVEEVMTTVRHVVAGDGESGEPVETPAVRMQVTITEVNGDHVSYGQDVDGGETMRCGGGFKTSGDLSGKFEKGQKFMVELFRVLAVLLFLGIAGALAGTDPLPQTREIYVKSGAPTNGTNCIQTITLGGTPTGGTFKLTYKGATTAAITWTATDATLVSRIDTALEALPTIGTGGVTTAAGTVSSGIGTVTVTFTGNNAKLLIPVMTVSSSLTGTSPTLACAITTAGVTADARSASIGALLVDNTTPGLYQNAGTSLNPSWTVVPTASDVLLASAPVFAAGLTASGSSANDFSGGTGTFKTSSGLTTISGGNAISTATLSGAGAISIVKGATKVTTTGTLQALTLADGADGQIVRVVHDVDGGSAVLTPTTKSGFTTITFTNAGETATLMFTTTRGWVILALNGAVAA